MFALLIGKVDHKNFCNFGNCVRMRLGNRPNSDNSAAYIVTPIPASTSAPESLNFAQTALLVM